MMETLLENYFWLIPIIAWVGFFALIGQLSGWKKFSRLYTERDVLLQSKKIFRWQSMGLVTSKISFTKYRNSVTIKTTMEGMQLSMPWIFRINHPPIFIPWTAVTHISVQKMLFWEMTEISIQEAPKKILFHRNIFKDNPTIPQSIIDLVHE